MIQIEQGFRLTKKSTEWQLKMARTNPITNSTTTTKIKNKKKKNKKHQIIKTQISTIPIMNHMSETKTKIPRKQKLGVMETTKDGSLILLKIGPTGTINN